MKRKVLIVDDSSANLYMLESLLKGYGFEVTLAENGREALDKARIDPPDLVVTDILMPVMDGYALCREWKSDDTLKHIPLVFYTATYTELKDEEFALSLGVDRFIVKPQEPDIFMNMIKEILDEKYMARQAAAKPLGEEMEFFRRYNEILFKKLEKKMQDLEIANQRLKTSEECYRLSFMNASDVIYTIDTDLKLLSISPSVERILGYKPQDFIGRPISDLRYILTPESYEQAIADIRLVLQGETNIETIYQFVAKDGTIKYGEVSRAPLMREGTIIGVISVARDITERKQAEKKLIQGEKKYRDLYDFLPIPVYEMDLEGNITAANRAAYKTFGGTEEDLKKGFKAWQILSPEDVAKSKMNIQMLLKGEHVTRTEYTLRKLDGAAFPSIIISSVIFDNDKPAGLRGAIIDITERKRTEEALRAAFVQRQELEFIVNHSPAVVWLWKAAEGWPVEYVSDNITLYGYTPDDFVSGRIAFATIIHPDDLPRVGADVEQYTHEGRTEFTQEYRVFAKSGDMHWIDDRTWVRRDPNGSVTHYQGIAIDITDRKKAEEALRESEGKYRSLVEHIHDAILLTKPDGSILDANKAACEMFGRSLDEIKNVGRSGLVDESDPRLYAALKERDSKGTASAEITMVRANGEKFPVEITSTIFTDVSGKQKTSMIIRDITERKRAEEKLRESEKRLSTIIDFLPDAIFAIDRDRKVIAWNRAMEKMSGIDAEDILGKGDYEYSLPFYGKRIPILIDLVFDYEEKNAKKYHFIKKEGDVLLAEGRVPVRGEEYELWGKAAPLYDASGNIVGAIESIRDVSEHKETEKLYKTLAESALAAVFIVQDGKIRFINTSAIMYAGYSAEELIGQDSDMIVHPEDKGMVKRKGREMLRGEYPSPYEYRMVAKDGQIKWIMQIVSPIQYEGKPAILGNAIDITGRKQGEEALKQSFERLRKTLGATIQAMVSTVEARDPYTAGHQRKVADLARTIATEMNLSNDQIEGIRMAGIIHDIGKISVPAEILSKPSRLTDIEFSLIKIHAQSGYNILKDIEFPWPIARMVLEHHERIDGSGYPNGLTRDNLLIESRILTVADVVEAIASHRPYRPALGIETALEEISKNRDILYDPDVVDACLKLFRERGYTLRV